MRKDPGSWKEELSDIRAVGSPTHLLESGGSSPETLKERAGQFWGAAWCGADSLSTKPIEPHPEP